MKQFFLVRLIRFVISACARNKKYDLPTDLNSFYTQHPLLFEQIFSYIDLDYSGLEKVKAEVHAKDYFTAASELIDYYQKSRRSIDFENIHISGNNNLDKKRLEEAWSVLDDIYSNQGVTGQQARLDNGLMEWKSKGPKNDTQWAQSQNRHYFFNLLLYGYQATSDEVFAHYFNASVIDWIYQNSLVTKFIPSGGGVMNAGSRMLSTWPNAFYGFQKSESFSPLARFLILMSIPEHAKYLRKYHSKHHNHAVKELSGLANLAVYWPEFKQSAQWIDYAVSQMVEEVRYEVYPDGVHKELSGHYHNNVRQYFKRFVDIVRKGNRELPPLFESQINKMNDYMAAVMQPSGHGLNNNDSDMDYIRNIIQKEAELSSREDWLYIASYGKYGKPPDFTSSFYPYGGQLVMRDGWSRKANWGFFDVGPWGTAHQHQDKLHLSITAYGSDILVDAGRYLYVNGPFRSYFKGSRSHNVVLVDGHEQNKLPRETNKPITKEAFKLTDSYDFSIASFDAGFGPLRSTHARAVFFDKEDLFWLIVDNINIDQPREITALWHFHPEVNVSEEQGVLTARTEVGNLLICPIGIRSSETCLLKGQTEPYIQGWWSKKYNHKEASTAAEIKVALERSQTFAWLMIPYSDRIPTCDVVLIHQDDKSLVVELSVEGKAKSVTIDFYQRPHLKVY